MLYNDIVPIKVLVSEGKKKIRGYRFNREKGEWVPGGLV